MNPAKPRCAFSKMNALRDLVLRMAVGSDLKGLEKMNAEEAQDIFLLLLSTTKNYLLDENKLDVKPDVDKNLANKEDHEVVEETKDDQDKVQVSKTKETEDVCLSKCEGQLFEIPNNEFEDENEETLVILKVNSAKDSAISGIFFPDECGSVAEERLNPSKDSTDDDAGSRMDESIDSPLNKKVNNNHKLFEEQIDENTKVEESYDSGYDDGNEQEVPVNNESVSTTGESLSNDTPESRLASEIKVQHKFDEISEVLAHEPVNNEDEARPNIENIENKEDLPRDSNTKEPIIGVTVTMDWREAEKGVVDKCEELQTKIDLYTPDDIDGHHNEEEFYKKLGAMQDSYSEAKKSIRDLLRDYDDMIPTQIKEHWKRLASEILERLKSHERQLRAAVTRAKGNLSVSASISSVSAESNASEVSRAKRKHALSKMKTNEKAIKKDAGKLQEKIFQIIDWKLEDDVMIGRGLKMADKWEKDLEKIIEKMRELETLQREFDVEESEVECERLGKLVEDLEEDVEEVKKKIVTEDNERELYSLDTLKVSKVNLPTFWGKDSEDFSRFKENIEKGFKTNRISRDEQIIKLRECLKGYARKLVPDSNVTEIKEAWRILKLAFGNPIKIINHRMEALMKLGMKPKSMSNHNAEIAWYIDLTTFLREIIDLGIKNPDYSELIFSIKFAMELRQLFPSGRLRNKLRECGGKGQEHLENMLELMGKWLENAQINQQENDITSKSALAICCCSSGSSISEKVEDSDDEKEEDFVDDRNSHESFGKISQQVGGANFIFAHMLPSFAFSEDYGNPSQTKSVTSFYKEKLVNAHNEWEMNESVEELLDEEHEDMFEYQEVSFEESDDDQDVMNINDDNISAAFKEAVSKDTNVAKKELHDYDETSGMESDNKFNIVVKEDKILVNQESLDERLAEDNEAVLEDCKGTTSEEDDAKGILNKENDVQGSLDKENDDQRSLLENDDKRIFIEDDDQKGSIDEFDDHSNTEDEEVLIKEEAHVGVPNDLRECEAKGQHDEILEVVYEDLNDALEVSVDDEDECDDAQTGKLSACPDESFHNVATQSSDEMPDNCEESTAKETDDKFSTEVDKEILNYVNETFEVMNEDLKDGLEVFEDDAAREHLNSDENADAALEDDEYQYEKPDVIKMLFKGTFSENAMEILENLNKFKKINFGNRDENGLDAHFSSPENSSYTFAEEVDDKDSETESFQVSEAIKNQSEPRDNDLNVKAKEVESDEDVIKEVVDIAQEIVNAEKSVFNAMNLLLSFLIILLATIPVIKFAVNILMCVLTLMYMHMFVALPLLDAMLNMFIETNTDFVEKVAQMVKMNGCCCASPSLLTGGERKDGGLYHAEETVTVYRSPTTMDSLNNLLAVNTDYTEMEEEPDYLASVDTLTQSNKTLYGKGHSF